MDVTDALKYVIFCSRILGAFPFEVKKSIHGTRFVESTVHLTYSKVLLCCSFFLMAGHMYWSATFVDNTFSVRSETAVTMVVITFGLTFWLMTPMLARMMLLKKNSFRFWLNKLQKVFSNLSEEEIKKLRKTSGVCLLLSFGNLVVLGTIDAILPKDTFTNLARASRTTHLFLMHCFVINFYLITCENKQILQQFILFVNMIRSHYIETNKLFGTMGTNCRIWADRIRDMRCRDIEVQDFIDFLHSYFAPIITIQFSWGFYTILFNFVVSLKFGLPSALQIVWVVVLFWDLISVCALCYFTEKEAQKTVHYLQNCFTYCNNTKVNEEVELFSLQVQHRKVEFYLTGLIKLDPTLIYTVRFLGSLTSHAVIFIHLKGESSDGRVCYVKIPTNCTPPS